LREIKLPESQIEWIYSNRNLRGLNFQERSRIFYGYR
jgi:hypothetical protein